MTEAQKVAAANLDQFTGTEGWHRWSVLFPQHLLTDGTQYAAESLGAYWLMDAIASHTGAKGADPEMQFWKLEKADNGGCNLVGRNDSNVEPFVVQHIEYTDFPEELMPFEIWVSKMYTAPPHHVLMLRSEY